MSTVLVIVIALAALNIGGVISTLLWRRNFKNLVKQLETTGFKYRTLGTDSKEISRLKDENNKLQLRNQQILQDNDVLNISMGDLIKQNKIYADTIFKHETTHATFQNGYLTGLTDMLNDLYKYYEGNGAEAKVLPWIERTNELEKIKVAGEFELAREGRGKARIMFLPFKKQ